MDFSLLNKIGVRGRLLVLILAAMLPLAALLGAGVLADHRATLERAQHEVLEAANLAATKQATVFEASRNLLNSLRLLPEVRELTGRSCDELITRIREANPQFNTMGVFDAGGTITCHSSLRKPQAFGDQDLAAKVLTPGGPSFALSKFQIGKASGKPTVIAAIVLPQVGGRAPGAIFASFNLDRLSEVAREASAGGRHVVAMIEPDTSRLVARFPPIAVPFGTPFGDHPLVLAARSMPRGGIVEGPGLDGIERVEGIAPVTASGVTGLAVVVGMARETVFAPARDRAVFSGAAVAASFLLVLSATWWLGSATQLRPIGRLTDSAERIGAGDFEARARLEGWQAPEFLRLASTLDEMGARLARAKEIERESVRSQARYRILAENTADLVTLVEPSGKRVYVSPACREMLGYEPDEMLAMAAQELAHPEDLPILAEAKAKLMSGTNVSNMQYRARHKGGHFLWVEVSGRIVDGEGDVVFLMRDITKRKQTEERLREVNLELRDLADRDGLTGLANRRAFDERLLSDFARSLREGQEMSVILFDVDRFKAYNDTYGHQAGDECLRRIAAVMQGELRRPGDLAARYGGEELVAILPGTDVRSAFLRAEAISDALRALRVPHSGSEHRIVTVSAGVASFCPGYGFSSPQDLLRAADLALYEAKRGGRDRVAA